MIRTSLATLIVLVLVGGFQGAAQAAALTPEERAQTVKALKKIRKDHWSEARDMVAATKDPLAARIYHWVLYTQHSKKTHFTGLTQFIRQNPDWPGLKTMREKAEESLSSDTPNRDMIAWFDDYPPLTGTGTDKYVGALLTTGQEGKAREFLNAWWGDTLLPRDQQKYLYKKYGRLISREAHIKRFDKLLFAQQYTNARAIAGVLGEGYPELAEARIGLMENKGDLHALIQRVPKYLMKDAGLVYERLRWRRENKQDDGAIALLKEAGRIEGINNPEDWWKERHIIIRRLMEDRNYKLAYQLAAGHIQKDGFAYAQAEWVAGFLALRFVNKPEQAYKHFVNLHNNVSTPISKSRGAYWAGRAAAKLGRDAEAQKWMTEAAAYQTTFYGQIALAEQAQKGDLLSIAPPELSAGEQKTFRDHDLIQAALVFHEAGMNAEATRFLERFAGAHDTAKAYRFAADFALELGRYPDAVRISKDATKEGLFLTAQSYPLITEHLQDVDVEWALVHALIRQESLFDQYARSPAGALGLMQVMPATARETAKKLGMKHSTEWLTDRPDHNIRIGTVYMEQLLRQFDGAYPLAIAAYNAGPGRVKSWIKTFGDPRKGEIDIVDWIELIPIYETRNYVQRVIENTYVYRLRLKNVQKKPAVTISMATPQNLQNL